MTLIEIEIGLYLQSYRDIDEIRDEIESHAKGKEWHEIGKYSHREGDIIIDIDRSILNV